MVRKDPERDEEAWRSIVENFGERAELEEEASGKPEAPDLEPAYRFDPVQPATDLDDVEGFIAPDPPLPPRPTRDRQLAWAGLLGAPLLLLCLMAGVRVPPLLVYAMVAGFVGGFVYLIFRLPRTPDDPFDDGARL